MIPPLQPQALCMGTAYTSQLYFPHVSHGYQRVFKNTVISGVLGHGQLKNIVICSGFCLAEHKNTVKNTVNSAVFSPVSFKLQTPRYSQWFLLPDV